MPRCPRMGEEEGDGVRSGPGDARTILLLHISSARPSKQPLMVRNFLRIYNELCSYFVSTRTNKRHHHHLTPKSKSTCDGDDLNGCTYAVHVSAPAEFCSYFVSARTNKRHHIISFIGPRSYARCWGCSTLQ